MRYLAFDIECCDGRHICEFGYVIANESFEVVEKRVLLINPKKPFKLTGRENRPDLELYFSEEEYYAAPEYPCRFDIIKELLEHEDQIVFGHSIANDIGFLREASKRYKLPTISFSFLDSQVVYGEYSNNKSRVSLANAELALELDKPEFLHKSDDDALLTLELVESICRRLEVTVAELMELCPTASGKSDRLSCQYTGSKLSEMLEIVGKNPSLLSGKKKADCLKRFVKRVKPQGRIQKSILNGSRICFSLAFERERLRESLILIQMLANVGCEYNTIISECDYYVASEEELSQESTDHGRYHSAVSGSNEQVRVLRWGELLDMLGTSEGELAAAEMPTLGSAHTKNDGDVYYSSGDVGGTLGDQLRAKGIDLFALIN